MRAATSGTCRARREPSSGDGRSGRSAEPQRSPAVQLRREERDCRSSSDSVVVRRRGPARARSTSTASVCRAASCRRSRRASVTPNAATRRRMSVEPAGGDQRVAGRDERAMAEPQRLGELVDVEVGATPGRASASTPRAPSARQVARRARAASRTSRSSARYGSCASPTRARSSSLAARTSTARCAARRCRARYRSAAMPSRQPGGLARHLRRDVRVAVAIAANPRSEADRRGVERQRAAGRRAARGRRCADSAAAPPTGSARRRRGPPRTSSSGVRRLVAHFVGLPRGRDLAPQRVDRLPRARPASGRADRGRARRSAMRLCFCSSVRRTISVGCAVSTSSIRSERTASASASAGSPPAAAARTSRRTSRAAAGRPGRARNRGGGATRWCCSAMLASVRKCANARATGSADAIGMSRSSRSMLLEASLVRACARFLASAAHLLDPFEERVAFVMPQHASPSSSPSSRTSSRSG